MDKESLRKQAVADACKIIKKVGNHSSVPDSHHAYRKRFRCLYYDSPNRVKNIDLYSAGDHMHDLFDLSQVDKFAYDVMKEVVESWQSAGVDLPAPLEFWDKAVKDERIQRQKIRGRFKELIYIKTLKVAVLEICRIYNHSSQKDGFPLGANDASLEKGLPENKNNLFSIVAEGARKAGYRKADYYAVKNAYYYILISHEKCEESK